MVGCITAYAEFHGTEKKLMRFSDSINSIDSILLWWRTLTDVEKASMKNIDELIDSCENIFMSERQAWVSSSMKSNTTGKDGNDGDSDDD